MSAIMKCLYNIFIYFYKVVVDKEGCREKLTITFKKVLQAFHPILIPKARFFEDPKILRNTSIYCTVKISKSIAIAPTLLNVER